MSVGRAGTALPGEGMEGEMPAEICKGCLGGAELLCQHLVQTKCENNHQS